MTGDAPQPGETPRDEGGPWSFTDPASPWWRPDDQDAAADRPRTPQRGAATPAATPTLDPPKPAQHTGEAAAAHQAGAEDVATALTGAPPQGRTGVFTVPDHPPAPAAAPPAASAAAAAPAASAPATPAETVSAETRPVETTAAPSTAAHSTAAHSAAAPSTAAPSTDKKLAAQRSAEQELTEPKPATERKPTEERFAERKLAELKFAERRAAAQQAAEQEAAQAAEQEAAQKAAAEKAAERKAERKTAEPRIAGSKIMEPPASPRPAAPDTSRPTTQDQLAEQAAEHQPTVRRPAAPRHAQHPPAQPEPAAPQQAAQHQAAPQQAGHQQAGHQQAGQPQAGQPQAKAAEHDHDLLDAERFNAEGDGTVYAARNRIRPVALPEHEPSIIDLLNAIPVEPSSAESARIEPGLEPDLMVLPEPERNRPTVALERSAVPGQPPSGLSRLGRARADRARADRALQDRVRQERTAALLETSPFWKAEEERRAQAWPPPETREKVVNAGQPPRRRRRPPRRPATGLFGLLALGLIAAFFAWVSAEPFWLAVGHGDRGTATVEVCTGSGVTQRCAGSFTPDDGSYRVDDLALFGVEPGQRVTAATTPARMVSSGSRQAYVGSTGLLMHLRWALSFALVLLCGLGIAALTGARRLDTARARRGATLISMLGPLLLLGGFLYVTY